MSNSVLFEPLKVGSLEIKKSRFVVPAMNGHSVDDHIFKERGIAYFAQRAKGGFGLILSEWLAVDPDGLGSLKQAAVWSDEYIPSLSNLAKGVHDEDGIIIGQLHHAGMKSKSLNSDFVPKAVSEINLNGKYLQAYSREDLDKVKECYISAARRLKEAGFDGVELHAAHGYLLGQFLSKKINRRIDEYGGNYDNRFRFIKEIIQGIKDVCGKDYTVGMRINAFDGVNHDSNDEENSLKDTCIYARLAEKAGLDYLSVSHRGIILPYFEDPGFSQEYTAEIKKHISIPVVYVGRVNDENVAESIISTGKADLIALGRQSICDPFFPLKIKTGKTDLIFRCMGCQQRCSPDVGCEADDIGSSCMINPFTNKETRWKITETESPKNIAVIGAGCAGLQSAWILAARGHKVTVYEKSDRIGGNLISASIPPKKIGFSQAIYTELQHCKYYGVEFVLNKEVTTEDLVDLKADCIIDATGSVPFKPQIEGIKDLPYAEDVLLQKLFLSGKKVAVLGGGTVGLETAEYLLNYGNKVDIIEMKDSIAEDMVGMVRRRLMAKVAGKIGIHTSTKLCKIEDNTLYVEKNNESMTLTGYDAIVVAMGYKSRNELQLSDCGIEFYTIGDAKQARNAKMAIYEATKLALTI